MHAIYRPIEEDDVAFAVFGKVFHRFRPHGKENDGGVEVGILHFLGGLAHTFGDFFAELGNGLTTHTGGFALGFCASVLAVHLVMARNKRTPPKTDRVIAVGVIAALAAGLATGSLVFSVASPLVVFAAGLGMSPPSAAKLRVIGVAIVIAGVASSAIALLR